MNFNVGIAYLATGVTAGIAVMALWRDPCSFVHRVFASGMVLFALDARLTGFAYPSASPDGLLFWQRVLLSLLSCRLSGYSSA